MITEAANEARKDKKYWVGVGLFALFILFLSLKTAAGWADANYPYRQQLTVIENAAIMRRNVPVIFNLTGTDGRVTTSCNHTKLYNETSTASEINLQVIQDYISGSSYNCSYTFPINLTASEALSDLYFYYGSTSGGASNYVYSLSDLNYTILREHKSSYAVSVGKFAADPSYIRYTYQGTGVAGQDGNWNLTTGETGFVCEAAIYSGSNADNIEFSLSASNDLGTEAHFIEWAGETLIVDSTGQTEQWIWKKFQPYKWINVTNDTNYMWLWSFCDVGLCLGYEGTGDPVGLQKSLSDPPIKDQYETEIGTAYTDQLMAYRVCHDAPNTFLGAEEAGELPSTTTPTLTPTSPATTDNLNLTATVTNNIGANLTACASWYKDSVNQTGLHACQAVTNNTQFSFILLAANTTAEEVWKGEVIPQANSTVGASKFSPERTIATGWTSITVSSPQNTTYYTNNISLTFTPIHLTDSTFTCFRFLNGVNYTIGSVANNTANTTTITSLAQNDYNLTIYCSDLSNKLKNNTVYLKTVHYEIANETYPSRNHETNTTKFAIQINTAPNVKHVVTRFYWNDTNSNTTTLLIAGNNFTYERQQLMKAIPTNATSITWYWNYTIYYTNGTSENKTSTSRTFYIDQAYYFHNISTDRQTLNYTEGETATITYVLNKVYNNVTISPLNLTFYGTQYPLTLASETAHNATFTVDVVIPFLNNIQENITYYGSVNISFLDFFREANSTMQYLLGNQLKLTNCTDYSSKKTLTFRFRNEEDIDAALTTSLNVAFNITWGTTSWRNFTFDFDDKSEYDVCIYPTDASFIVDAVGQYNASGYVTRWYYLTNGNLTSTRQFITLYNLDDSLDTETEVTVVDAYDQEEVNVITKFMRWYSDTNSYITVAMGRTDIRGITTVPLNRNNAFYKVILERDGSVLQDISPVEIPAPDVLSVSRLTLTTLLEDVGKYWNVFDKYTANCEFTNATKTLRCTLADTSGFDVIGRLLVEKRGLESTEVICDITSPASSSATAVCVLPTWTGLYSYAWYGTYDQLTKLFYTDFISFEEGAYYGDTGLFILFIASFTFLGMSLISPAVAVLSSFLVLVFGKFTHLITISPVGLIGYAIVTFLLMLLLGI